MKFNLCYVVKLDLNLFSCYATTSKLLQLRLLWNFSFKIIARVVNFNTFC